MKHIKSVNEFFNFFKKDEEDELALEFIKRIKKVKGICPYEISKLTPEDVLSHYNTNDLTNNQVDYVRKYSQSYKIVFDDVVLVTTLIARKSGGLAGLEEDIYFLRIDGEKINCRESYRKKIFELTKSIFANTQRLKIVSKVRSNMNTAADLL